MHGRLVMPVMSLLGLVACAPGAAAPAAQAPEAERNTVRPGLEVLLADSAHLVRGRRVGLVTNHTGLDGAGVHGVERLRGAGVNLVALFSPEHGFRGAAAPGAAIGSVVDSATGIPIYSLYGRTVSPTDSMLQGIDVLLVDLQDVGARYYTYVSTAVKVLEAAAPRRIPVVILDRPNPIGSAVQGTVLEPAHRTFVGMLTVPMRHGMTMGELVRYAQDDLDIRGVLHVVPVSGWRRTEPFDSTGLPFVPPSPNLRSVESLFHYPGTTLFEGTNLSVGRGSDAPFEQVGAPWLDTAAVLSRIRAAAPPGVSFRGVVFTPRTPGDGKYADTALTGIRLTVTDRDAYNPSATAVRLLSAVLSVHGEQFGWIPAHFDRLAGTSALRDALAAGADPDSIVAGWKPALARFRERRRDYLIYPE
ncbi:MAG: DUF1343 domain-containing protein [Gemmatimonadota bacterium]|nr:DUF1343 domain-containing protein [Gemmatimonadota bacterium]